MFQLATQQFFVRVYHTTNTYKSNTRYIKPKFLNKMRKMMDWWRYVSASEENPS